MVSILLPSHCTLKCAHTEVSVDRQADRETWEPHRKSEYTHTHTKRQTDSNPANEAKNGRQTEKQTH